VYEVVYREGNLVVVGVHVQDATYVVKHLHNLMQVFHFSHIQSWRVLHFLSLCIAASTAGIPSFINSSHWAFVMLMPLHVVMLCNFMIWQVKVRVSYIRL
jgi:hypothetical protein